MITAKEFVTQWDKKKKKGLRRDLLRFSAAAFKGVKIEAADKKFLMEAGLPDGAAPFLSFELPEDGALPNVADMYDLEKKFERYRRIGFDGGGSPIVIDVKKPGPVFLLDDEFGFKPKFMNSSIRQLAECLLIYREFHPLFDDEKWEWPADVRKKMDAAFKAVDAACMKKGAFWTHT